MSTPQGGTRCLHFSAGLTHTHLTRHIMSTGAGSDTLLILFCCFFWVWAHGMEGTGRAGKNFNKTPVVKMMEVDLSQHKEGLVQYSCCVWT